VDFELRMDGLGVRRAHYAVCGLRG
jgi:hypothetical protein